MTTMARATSRLSSSIDAELLFFPQFGATASTAAAVIEAIAAIGVTTPIVPPPPRLTFQELVAAGMARAAREASLNAAATSEVDVHPTNVTWYRKETLLCAAADATRHGGWFVVRFANEVIETLRSVPNYKWTSIHPSFHHLTVAIGFVLSFPLSHKVCCRAVQIVTVPFEWLSSIIETSS